MNVSALAIQLDDAVLGLPGHLLHPSHRIDVAVRFFGTWSGSDKLMMTAQYGSRFVVPYLLLAAARSPTRRAKLLTAVASALTAFAAQCATARRVSGLWGLLSILRALSQLERTHPQPARPQLTLQRLQGVSMLAFYPLEYISYFGMIFGGNPRGGLTGEAGLWSVRAWGIYVALQVGNLVAEWRDLEQRLGALERDEHGEKDQENHHLAKEKVIRRKEAIAYQLVANVSRLPVIVHWSLRNGWYGTEYYSTIFSFISAIASLLGGWEATRLLSPNK